MRLFKTSFIAFFFILSISCLSAQLKDISLNSSEITWHIASASDYSLNQVLAANIDLSNWVPAVVPGTVFGSYVEAGLEKDPNFGDNIHQVDKTKYDRDFWYRTSFDTPELAQGELLWLNFDGINRKGEIYLNGQRLGLLDGFMHRGHFNITPYINKSGKNTLVVLAYWPGVPIPNHASPTYISSASWDWMPYVPGLLSGITDDVFLTVSGAVTLIDPWVRTNKIAEKEAVLKIQYELKNNTNEDQRVVIHGVINPGGIRFSQSSKISAGKQRDFTIGGSRRDQILVPNPLLWWPNGYGEPNLYTCDLSCEIDGKLTDQRTISFGIKEYSYEIVDEVFRIKINGEPIYLKGGNWGMSEYMLRCRGEEYDLKVKLHKDMNYNMIRNWIGSTTDEEFYAACDKYGIMVWDDFWLNSHTNLPDDVFAFNHNAVEKIKRFRNHPSIAVWCGDNEGYPLPPLNGWLEENVKTFDGGDRHYHANSNSDGLSGSGPWTNFHPIWYFSKKPLGFGKNMHGDWGLRTEIGTAVFVNFDSFKKFMPQEDWWPKDWSKNEMWNKHYFGPLAGNAGPAKYFSTIEMNYGKPKGIEDFCRKAQLVNYESNRAMYEGWQHHIWNDASGILTWMSQSAYPSFVWQTYDYYYDMTGAYWGVKKACEPLHVQWSYADNSVKVINTTLNEVPDLKVNATVYNLDGKVMSKYGNETTITAQPNTASEAFQLQFTVDNLAVGAKAYASSTSKDAMGPEAVADGSDGSRWASEYIDNQWIYIDLGETKEFANIVLNWENAHAKSYKLHVSDDGQNWQEIYQNLDSKGGIEDIKIKPLKTQFVKVECIERATQWGFSLYEIELYAAKRVRSDLTDVHFIKLEMTDKENHLVSENFYWRSNRVGDYQALNKLPKAKLDTKSTLTIQEGKALITVQISNKAKTPAFAIHVQAKRKSDGERLLPAILNDNYFTLLKGESKEIKIAFDAELLKDDQYLLEVVPYNR